MESVERVEVRKDLVHRGFFDSSIVKTMEVALTMKCGSIRMVGGLSCVGLPIMPC